MAHAGLREHAVVRPGEALPFLGRDDAGALLVALVADQIPHDILRRLVNQPERRTTSSTHSPGKRVELVEPHGDGVKGVALGDIVNNNDAMGAAVVTRRERSEALLSRRVLPVRVNTDGGSCIGASADVPRW